MRGNRKLERCHYFGEDNIMLEKLGIKRIINASGTLTVLGGNRLAPGAIEAMREVYGRFVDMEVLSENAGRYIADLVGAADAYITGGASSGLVLSISAAMTGGDIEKMAMLPFTDGLRNRVIVQQSHTVGNPYYHIIDIPGARLNIVGGKGNIHPSDIRDAIDEETAAIVHFLYEPQDGEVPLSKVIDIAHEKNIPVIVDAAAELPPSDNLKKIVQSGADIVIFSGGKDIGAPSDTGVIMGSKRGMIQDCRKLGPLSYLYSKGERRTFIGRPMKVSKEDIMAFTAAFEAYLATNHNERLSFMDRMSDRILKGMQEEYPNLKMEKSTLESNQRIRPVTVPKIRIALQAGMADACTDILKRSEPAVYVYSIDDDLYINTQCLLEEEVDPLIQALLTAFRRLNV